MSSSLSASSFLPWGDMNVVVVTDVHSWVAGHPSHAETYDADYGHVLSFYRRLQDQLLRQNQRQGQQQRDLFFVMNGDFMDGTGLSTVPPQYLTPILQYMPWDAVNMGNHELYHNETVQFLLEPNGFIEHWKGHYLTSNVLVRETQQPIGHRYTLLKGRHSTILAFGFLFNFQGACEMTQIVRVQEAVQQEWFQNALLGMHDHIHHDQYDAILVLAHMDCTSPLVNVILEAIRSIVGPNMPVQFVTGHTHRRCFQQLDAASSSMEAGRFLDTVGFVSFPKQSTYIQQQQKQQQADEDPLSLFRYAMIDGSKQGLRQALGWDGPDAASHTDDTDEDDDFMTHEGRQLSALIRETQRRLDLEKVLGCSPAHFALGAGYFNNDAIHHSLWGLYLNHVVPTQLFFPIYHHDRVFVQTTGAFRYSLFPGNVTLDDVIEVCPFNDTVYQVYVIYDNNDTTSTTPGRRSSDHKGGILGKTLMDVLNELPSTLTNDNGPPPGVVIGPEDDIIDPGDAIHPLPAWGVSISTASNQQQPYQLDPHRYYQLFAAGWNYAYMAGLVSQATGQSCVPIPFQNGSCDTDCSGTLSSLTTTETTTTNMWRDFVVQYWPTCEQASKFYSRYVIHNKGSSSTSTSTGTTNKNIKSYSSFSFVLLLNSPIQQHKQQPAFLPMFRYFYCNKKLLLVHPLLPGVPVLIVLLIACGVVRRRRREPRQERWDANNTGVVGELQPLLLSSSVRTTTRTTTSTSTTSSLARAERLSAIFTLEEEHQLQQHQHRPQACDYSVDGVL